MFAVCSLRGEGSAAWKPGREMQQRGEHEAGAVGAAQQRGASPLAPVAQRAPVQLACVEAKKVNACRLRTVVLKPCKPGRESERPFLCAAARLFAA